MAHPNNLTNLAQYAEKKGFDFLVEPSDHIVVPDVIHEKYPYSSTGEYTDTKEDLEQLTEITFVAAKTKKARLLSAIMVLPYRQPLLLTKILSTLDVLSNGRLVLGIGIGWMRDEFEILKISFHERGKITDEYIQILRLLWSEKRAAFNGKYFSFPSVELLPRPIQKRLPIWIGGESPGAIRRAVMQGDGWLPLSANPKFPLTTAPEMKDSLDYLKLFAQQSKKDLTKFRVGYMIADYRITKTDGNIDKPFVGTPSKIIRQIRAFQDVGVTFFGFSLLRNSVEDTKENVDVFISEILPSIRK
jgi:probable F420-dependent oxidoreductase